MDQAVWTRSVFQSPVQLARTGFAGAVLMAVSSYWVGALPSAFRQRHVPVISLVPLGSPVMRTAYYLGEAALVLAWLQLGRLTLAKAEGTDWRALRRTALLWLAPLAVSLPIGSRDVWAYAAQWQLQHHGIDPYKYGPALLHDDFSRQVSVKWLTAPTPYGPLWMLLGHLCSIVIGNNLAPTIVVLRLLAVAGMLLLAWAVPQLTERAGGRADLAVWLAVANPLMLVLGVGGAHNDLLMVGLMVAGLVFVTGPGSIWRSLVLGTVLITCAVAIKSPAVVAVAFAVPLWLAHAPFAKGWRTGRGAFRASLVVTAAALVSFAVITAVSGVGLGWAKQVNSSAIIVTWLSVPTALTIAWHAIQLRSIHNIDRLDSTMRAMRTVGTVVTVLVLIWAWFAALRRQPWALLAGSFFVVVLLGPSVLVWYFCWPIALAALVLVDRRGITALTAVSVVFVATMRPNGNGLTQHLTGVPIMLGALAVSLIMLVPLRLAPQRDEPA